MTGHKTALPHLAFSPKGDYLLSDNQPGEIRLWHLFHQEKLSPTLIWTNNSVLNCQGATIDNIQTEPSTLLLLKQQGAHSPPA